MTDQTPCAVHPDEPVIGACQRCGDFICRLCLKGKRLVCSRCAPVGESPPPDVTTAIGYTFKDPDWIKKIAIGGVCFVTGSIFVLPLFILMGYQLRVARREQRAPQTLLPEWDGVGDLLASGFTCWLSQVIPVFLFMSVVGLLLALVIAIGIASGAGGMGGNQVATAIGAIGFVGAILLIVPISLAFSLFMPAVQVHYVRTGKILAALDLRKIWDISAGRFGDYILLFVFHFLVQMIATIVGEMACGVGLLATLPWAMIVQGYLVGRYAGWLDAQEGTLES